MLVKKAPASTGPSAGAAASVAHISSAQAQVLKALTDSMSAKELASATGQHHNTVRGHLEVLVERGLVARTTVLSGQRGRPAYRYAPATPPRDRLAASLINALAGHIRETSPRPGRIAESLGRAAAVDHDNSAGVIATLTQLGFAPEPVGPGRYRLTACPLVESARNDPEVVCGFHRGLTMGLLAQQGLATGVKLLPFSEDGACMLVFDPSFTETSGPA